MQFKLQQSQTERPSMTSKLQNCIRRIELEGGGDGGEASCALKPDGEAVYGLKTAEVHSEDKLRVAFGCAENSTYGMLQYYKNLV